ncbi:histone deacetylase 8 [Canna indica]|uniref:Histone deacetylase 8 n=1 Tax=Canna indica TaxID=4628 RepID=A0AAQ3KIS6_9LILI|nr:histone deacetylase 8 [Canna indica]
MGQGDEGYAYAMDEMVVPVVHKYELDLVVLVVGQDSSADYGILLCSSLIQMEGNEGGYHITYSTYCLHATLEGVLNLPAPLLSDPIAFYPEDKAFSLKVVDAINWHWKESISFMS